MTAFVPIPYARAVNQFHSGPASPSSDLSVLLELCVEVLAAGQASRGGPVPAGEPRQVMADVDAALSGESLPLVGIREGAALVDLVAAATPADAEAMLELLVAAGRAEGEG